MNKSEVLSTVRNAAKDVWRHGLDIVLPPRDPFRDNDESDWAKVSFLDEPCCAQCGFPFNMIWERDFNAQGAWRARRVIARLGLQ